MDTLREAPEPSVGCESDVSRDEAPAVADRD